ncbi:MAG TPA: Hint domain-containing protein [Rhodopila sp.]|nr:Hint domain-containing protein [Rhodopila sp.]
MSLTNDPTITITGIGTRPATKAFAILSNNYRVVITQDNTASSGPYDMVMTIVTEDGTAVSQRDITSDLTYSGSSAVDTGDTAETASILPLGNGDFVLSWSDSTGGVGEPTNLYFRVYNSSGVAITATTEVDSVHTTGDLNRFQKLSLLADGNFSIVWAENGTSYSLRIFKPDGTAVTNQISIDSVSGDPGGAEYSHIAASSGTTTLVVYTAYGTSGSVDNHYYYTLFDETGTAIGTSHQLSATPDSGSAVDSVATLSDGNFVIGYRISTSSQYVFAILTPSGTFIRQDQALHSQVATNFGVYALASGGFLVTSGGSPAGTQLTGDIYDNTGTLLQSGVALTSYGSDTPGGGTISGLGYLIASGPYSGVAVVAREAVGSTSATDQIFGHTNGTVVCFLRGTQIATPDGERAIEKLMPGDMAITAGGAARRIVWIGKGKVLATAGRRSAATPVIVRKGALADNVPNQDLRMTKAHGLYLGGVLIPVEFLVNHRTILWDDRAQEVEIFHVELDSHDVLLANGAPAESFRDDGNRWLFQNARSGWDLPPQAPYAPVLTGGAVVDAVWRRLLDRAGPRALPPMTDDADVHLVVDGQRMDAVESDGMVQVFRLSRRPERVYVASREVVPAEQGLARDSRSLGVALRRIAVRQGTKFDVVPAEDARLTDGFHPYEAAGNLRWTDGYAALPIEAFTRFTGAMEVVLHLAGTTRYPVNGSGPARAAA